MKLITLLIFTMLSAYGQAPAPPIKSPLNKEQTEITPPTSSINLNQSKQELPIADSLMLESLNVKGSDIRDLIQGIAMQFNLNIYMSPEVQGETSVNFNQIAVKRALEILIEENGYIYEVSGRTIKVKKAPKKIVKKIATTTLKIEFKKGMVSLDIQGETLAKVAREITQKTGVNIIVDQSVSSKINAFVKNVKLDQGIRLLAQSNGLMARERKGVYTIYKQESKSAGMNNIWIKVIGDLVDVELTNAPIGQVISEISAQSGINTVVYGKLQGNVTAKIMQSNIQDIFQYLFRDNEYTFWNHKGIYFIGPAKMRSYEDTKLLVLKHLKADEVLEVLPKSLTKEADIQVIKGKNALMVMAEFEIINGIENYVATIDLPVPMILIEATVIDIDLDKVRDYGLNLFIGKAPVPGNPEPIYPNIDQTINSRQAESFFNGMPGMKDVVNLPKDFFAQLKALEGEKYLKVRSKPQIATLNGQTATLTVGQTQYFLLQTETDYNQSSQALTSRSTERFEKIEANVKLTVTPWVTGEGEITAEIIPDFTEPEGSFDSSIPPTLNHRLLKSQVRLRDGETIILGGLVKESRQEVHNQVPFLGSIPYLGWLFKNVSYVDSRSQLMIFVTPRIYYGEDSKVDIDEKLKEFEDQ